MKQKKRTARQARRMLCAFLAVISLWGLLPGKALAAEGDLISNLTVEATQPSVAALAADENLRALEQQLEGSANGLRYVRLYYAGNTANCVDIPGDRVHKDGTQGILYEAHFANPNQIFTLRFVGSGVYQIICLESGKLLEVKDGSRTDCAAIVQRSIHENPNGKWKLIQNSDGTTSFQNVATGGMLNARGGQADASELIQYHDDGTVARKFYVKEVSEAELLCATGGRYVRILYAINPSMCLDVPAEGIANNGTQLQLWDQYYAHQNQVYALENTGSGWVIKNHQSGKIIEVRNSSHQSGAQVAQWSWHNAPCSRWDLIANFDGTVSFRNRESELYLNLCGGGTGKNGQKLIQYFDDNSESMRWLIHVMTAEDVLSAVYEREITSSDISWTPEHPLVATINTTGWAMRENGTWHYPAPGQKVFVSAEFLDPNTVTNILKHYAYSPSVLDEIKAVVKGEAGEEAAAYILKQLGLEIPGVGAAIGALQTILDIQNKDERNRFLDAVRTNNPQERSGVILYTYKTVTQTPAYSKVNGRWKAAHRIETVTSVEYGSWNGDNFGAACTLPVSGATGAWHYTFK